MTDAERLDLLLSYRRCREDGNRDAVAESSGRLYCEIPEALVAIGRGARGVGGFVRAFRSMLDHSPVEVRRGELLVGDFYYLLPYEIVPMDPPMDWGEAGAAGAMPVVPSGHTTVNLERGLRLGWADLRDYAASCLAGFDPKSAEAEYLRGAIGVIGLIQLRILSYAAKCDALEMEAASRGDYVGALEYGAIADCCRRTATDPPRSFRDALQWYAMYATFERSTSTGMGSVRLDQVFWPFYERDIESGAMTRCEARCLLQALMLKQTLFCTIGGQRPDGECAENDLTFLVLEAYDSIGGPSNLSVRLCNSSSQRLYEHATSVLARHGSGVPILVNDEAIIPSLTHFGFAEAEARDYCFSGCFWWVVPGKEYPSHDLAAVSGARALLLALDDLLREQDSHSECDPAASAGCAPGYEQLWQAYCARIGKAISALIDSYAVIDPWLAQVYPEMVISLLMDGTLETGRDVNNAGVPYSMTTVLYVGLANVVDSLVALQKVVFEDKSVTLAEYVEALKADFEGYPAIHDMARSAPKYGGDDAQADDVAAAVSRQFKESLAGRTNSKGFALRPAFYSWHRHIFEGRALGATPDGRRAGMPLAHGGNPSPGSAQSGITAQLLSMAKLGHLDSAGCPAHLHFLLPDDAGRQRALEDLVRAAFGLGLPHLIVNAVDGEMLRDAIERPGAYSDLTVRVTGYSARFTQLDRAYQEEMASRDSH